MRGWLAGDLEIIYERREHDRTEGKRKEFNVERIFNEASTSKQLLARYVSETSSSAHVPFLLVEARNSYFSRSSSRLHFDAHSNRELRRAFVTRESASSGRRS